MTIQEIRNDLRAIKYYYSKQKEFEKAAETVGESKIVETVKRLQTPLRGSIRCTSSCTFITTRRRRYPLIGIVAWSISGGSISSCVSFF